MRQKPTRRPSSSEQIVKDIKRNTRKQYGAEETLSNRLNAVFEVTNRQWDARRSTFCKSFTKAIVRDFDHADAALARK
jgi:phosphoketolase